MVLLSVSGVTVEYGTDVVLNNINFSINEGDRLGIVGVNGAGKSTLAKIIAGTFSPSAGSVYIARIKRFPCSRRTQCLKATIPFFPKCRTLSLKSSRRKNALPSFPKILKITSEARRQSKNTPF